MRRCTLSEGAQAVVAGEVNAGIRRGRRRLGGRVEKWPVNLKNPAGGRTLSSRMRLHVAGRGASEMDSHARPRRCATAAAGYTAA
jgi:hypothetical protein